MREIAFRGKRIGTGEWIEGYLVVSGYSFYIAPWISRCTSDRDGNLLGNFIEVDPDTVGQYTGMADKNGKKIFEGDLLRVGSSTIPLLVEFANFSWECTRKDRWEFFCHRLEEESGKYEVVGNIHDNPELLEGEESES